MTVLSKPVMRRIHGAMFKLPLMITCEAFEDFILAYLEDELPRGQRVIFDMHLKLSFPIFFVVCLSLFYS